MYFIIPPEHVQGYFWYPISIKIWKKILLSGFMNKSAALLLKLILTSLVVLLATKSFTKWYQMFMCFAFLVPNAFSAQVIAAVLSTWCFGVSTILVFSSHRKCSVPRRSEQHSDKETYSASAVGKETHICFWEDHINRPSFQNQTHSNFEFLPVLSAAKSESEKKLS